MLVGYGLVTGFGSGGFGTSIGGLNSGVLEWEEQCVRTLSRGGCHAEVDLVWA